MSMSLKPNKPQNPMNPRDSEWDKSTHERLANIEERLQTLEIDILRVFSTFINNFETLVKEQKEEEEKEEENKQVSAMDVPQNTQVHFEQ